MPPNRKRPMAYKQAWGGRSTKRPRSALWHRRMKGYLNPPPQMNRRVGPINRARYSLAQRARMAGQNVRAYATGTLRTAFKRAIRRRKAWKAKSMWRLKHAY